MFQGFAFQEPLQLGFGKFPDVSGLAGANNDGFDGVRQKYPFIRLMINWGENWKLFRV